MLALLAGYLYVYQIGPFSDTWNSLLIELADPFTALLGAVMVTGVLLHYRRADKPYPVWLFFTLGMWFWVLAESTWSYIDFSSGATPSVGLPDVFWFIGYGLLGLALVYQYSLVFRTKGLWWMVLASWAGIVIVDLALVWLGGLQFSPENLVNYAYPLLDFGLCLASIRLFMTFGAGKLSRPWIGLLVMGISDAVFAWVQANGQYQVWSNAGMWLSTFMDTSYVAAYLILAFGFLLQYLLLRYGPEEAR
jgi:hypothetical protein